jgi:hypothetical protein
LVPLAIFAGNPSKIRRERLITDPPPESVLIKPTKIPAIINITISIPDISRIISPLWGYYWYLIPLFSSTNM